MSLKELAEDSDSGHDSADSLAAGPVDDRERIVHLETAVAWIREEMENLRRYDKEILQDLWKVRRGIHEIRDTHRKQIDAEQKYLEVNNTSISGHRRLSRTSAGSPESPTSPVSPFSPPPSTTRLSASAFNLKDPQSSTAKSSDDHILESFFGSDSMNKVNAMMRQSTDSLVVDRKSQSTDRLLLAELPPLPEKRRSSRGNQISRSPKTSRVHASTPDMTSLKRNIEPVSDVGVEMQKLRMRLRETANQTVAEIEERFSPKFNRLTLGPPVDITASHIHAGHFHGDHTHQGSLDSFPSPVPPRGRVDSSSPSQHSRQQSLPLSMIGQTHTHSSATTSPPKSTSPVSHPSQHSPTSRSPTPPHQLPHARHPSASSSNLSGLITTCYQPHDKPTGLSPTQPQPYEVAKGASVLSYGRPPPPSMSRQYSPSTNQPLEHSEYVFGTGRLNKVHSSNPNLLGGAGGQDSSTHYSTAVIKKRRPSGSKNGTETQTKTPSNASESGYDKLQAHNPSQGSNQSHRIGRTHSPQTQYSRTQNGGSVVDTQRSYRNQRSVPGSSSETNFKRSPPEKIKPYMTSGELRSSMRQFQYVPFAEQKRSLALAGRGHTAMNDPENTWL